MFLISEVPLYLVPSTNEANLAAAQRNVGYFIMLKCSRLFAVHTLHLHPPILFEFTQDNSGFGENNSGFTQDGSGIHQNDSGFIQGHSGFSQGDV